MQEELRWRDDGVVASSALTSMLLMQETLRAAFVALTLSTLAARGAEPSATDFYEQKVRPIFRDHCYKCHSHSADKIKGGLVLDSREGVLEGGDTGAAIVPGVPEKSLLIEAVNYGNTDLQMPPKGKKLSSDQIAVLNEWVKLGAPWSPHVSVNSSKVRDKITQGDREWWAFQPLVPPKVPSSADNEWAVNEIDKFILQGLRAKGLHPAPHADKVALIRRAYFDVIGLPPSPAEVDAFIDDQSTDAYVRVIDALLASPRYGERWARHWLDLVRYAESDGFRVDDYRPNAWRYRDYVIRAFNNDKPYDRFVCEQLAGDEIAPSDPEARVATGYLRHWVYEYNNRDVVGQWTNILNDLTDVTADVFMGLGLQCARCHDHKFDPILQKDYYRLQAFFAPILPRDDLRLVAPDEEADYAKRLESWKEKTAELRREIDAIEEPHKKAAAEAAIVKFPPETQLLIRKPAGERTPLEQQLAELAYRQVTYEFERLLNKMRGPDKERLVVLYKQLSTFDGEKPAPLPEAFCVTDVGPIAPAVRIPKKSGEEIAPGFLTILDEKPARIAPRSPDSTGRRAELARWLTSPDNPLTTRVIVNRVWQYHFGRGLVATSSDFGKLGEKPSHPELLDWLARWFVEHGWSFKQLHRLILLSATYQQAASNDDAHTARLADPENRLLWHAATHRLDAEQIRDAILSATGELDLTAGGPGVDYAKPRRTIYTKVIRNTRDPLLEVFDAPDAFASASLRNVTTTPTQSLFMINSGWSLQRAEALAGRVGAGESMDDQRVIETVYRLTLGRVPSATERENARRFLDGQMRLRGDTEPRMRAAPFLSDKMPFRDGRAAVFAAVSGQDRLTVPDNACFPAGDFTAEAFIVLKSLYESGEVRTIVSHWDGKRGHPGWSFGVTSKESRYKPQTLVLLLCGDQPWSEGDPVEPIFSGLHIDLGKPYFVAVSVKLDDTRERGITFYAKDLSNDDEPIQMSQARHMVVSGIRSTAPVTIGARSPEGHHCFDGLVDDVRISASALAQDQLLLFNERGSEQTVGWWKFEIDPGVYKDSSSRGNEISAPMVQDPGENPRRAALVDFCHVLLNSSEFLYVD
jgi:hypothetical protein